MKIIHIIPSLGRGGAERLVIDSVKKLVSMGHECYLVTFYDKNEYEEDCAGISLKCIPVDVQVGLLKKNNINVSALQAFLEQVKPDVIHSHLFEAEFKSRFCRYPKARWFSHGHDNMVQLENFTWRTLFSKKLLTQYYEKRVLLNNYKKNGGNHFIAVSKNNHYYLRKVVPGFLTTLLPNAIDVRKFQFEGEKIHDGRPLQLINVGSLNANKNQQFLLSVAKELVKKGIDFRLTIVGDGPLKQELQEKIKAFNLSNKVVMAGLVAKVQELLWQSDIYLHSSFSESFGLTMVEAMAAGLPVICSNAGGNEDLIQEGENGFLLAEFNAVDYAEKIRVLTENRALYLKMANYSSVFAKQFDFQNYTKQLMKIYLKD